MKQNSSGNQLSPFRTRFREQLRSNRFMFIVLIIINLLGLPVTVFSYIRLEIIEYNRHAYSTDTGLMIYSILSESGLVFIIASVLAGAVCTIKIFRHCLNKQKADMILSLPADRKSLFKADFLAGLVIYIVPVLISSVITVLIITANFQEETYEYIFGIRPDLYTAFMIISIIISMLLFYSYCVLCTVHSSSVVSAIANILIMNVSLYLAVNTSVNIIGNNFIYSNYMLYSAYISSFLSPAGLFTASFQYQLILHPVLVLAVNLIAAASAAFLAYIVYIRKRPENISEKITEPGVYCIIIFSAAVSLLSALKSTHSITAAVFITIVSFIIAEYIRKKKTKGKNFSVIYPTVCMAAAFITALSLPAVIDKTGYFGLNDYIPDSKEIYGMEINGDIPGTFGRYITIENDNASEIAELVTALNRNLIDSGISQYSNEDFRSYSIAYYLKNGRILRRNYYGADKSAKTREAAAEIGASGYIKNDICEQIKEDLSYSYSDFGDYSDEPLTYHVNFKTDISPDELISILTEEIQSATKNDLLNATDSPYSIGYGSRIPSCYEKTISYIQKTFLKEEYLKK